MSAIIRKHQTTLICSGFAVIAFGLWSIVRAFLLFYFNFASIHSVAAELVAAEDASLSVDMAILIAIILAGLMLGTDLIFRLYVGLAALSEGGGKRRRITYLVLSALYLVFSLCTDVSLVISELDAPTMRTVTAVLVDFSSCAAFAEIIHASLAIRRYEREEAYAA